MHYRLAGLGAMRLTRHGIFLSMGGVYDRPPPGAGCSPCPYLKSDTPRYRNYLVIRGLGYSQGASGNPYTGRFQKTFILF